MDGAMLPGGTLTTFLAMLLLRAAWHKAQAFPRRPDSSRATASCPRVGRRSPRGW